MLDVFGKEKKLCCNIVLTCTQAYGLKVTICPTNTLLISIDVASEGVEIPTCALASMVAKIYMLRRMLALHERECALKKSTRTKMRYNANKDPETYFLDHVNI